MKLGSPQLGFMVTAPSTEMPIQLIINAGDFHIPMTVKFEEEIKSMCNLSVPKKEKRQAYGKLIHE